MSDKTSGPRSKVARLIEKYELEEIGADLEDQWTRSEDRVSLRELAEYFNRELLGAVLAETENGDDPFLDDTTTIYRHLTDEEISSGVRTATRNRLEQRGIDIDTVMEDFVSRQAIHTYLTKHRGATAPSDESSPAEHRDRRRENIQRLMARLEAVTRRFLSDLRDADRLSIGEFEVVVSVRVHCTDCGIQRPVSDILSQGRCDCQSEPGTEV